MSDDEKNEEKSDDKPSADERPATDSKLDRNATTRREKRSPQRRRPRAVVAEIAVDPAEDVVAPKALGGAVRLAEEKAARRFLTVGVTLAIVGLAMVGTGPSEAGMALSLAGLLTLIYGIHTFGRLGPVPAK